MAIKLFIFLISPILSLLVSLRDIFNGKKESTYIFALCMGVFAYLTAPASDLYPHYLIFESFHNISLPAMILLLEEDILIPFTDYVFVNNGINYEWIRFLICTFQYMVLAYVFNGCTEKMNLSSKRYLFLIVLLYTNFLGTFVGVRGPLAATFYFLAVYLLFLKKKKYTPIGYFTLACLSHFFLISVTIFTILIYFLFRFRVNKKLLYLIIFSSLLSRIYDNQLLRREIFPRTNALYKWILGG